MPNRFIAPDGQTTNRGTEDSPWPLAEVLADSKRLFAQPGDTVTLLSGTYYWPDRSFNRGFRWAVRGEPDGGRIDFRARGRVIVDGGIFSDEKATPRHSRIFGVECLASENLDQTRKVDGEGSDTYRLLKRPAGNIDLSVGHDLSVINCLIHHASSGIGLWKTVSGNSLIYGNVIYDNGWIANDRKHGHGLYAQNSSPDWKRILRNIFTRSYQQSAQIYGSDTADCHRFEFSENVSYASGAVIIQPHKRSLDLKVNGNLHYDDKFGYGIANFTNAQIRDNVCRGDFGVRRAGEDVLDGTLDIGNNLGWMPGWSVPRLDGKNVPIPNARAWVHVNEFDETRATVTIHNYKNAPSIDLSFGDWVKPGDVVHLFDPTDLFGAPLDALEMADGGRVTLLLDGPHACYVAIKEHDPCFALRSELDATRKTLWSVQDERDRLSQVNDSLRGQIKVMEEKRDSLLGDVGEVRKILNRWSV